MMSIRGSMFLGSGSSTSSSSSSSSTTASYPGSAGHTHQWDTWSDPVCAMYYLEEVVEDLSHLLKIIIELYELDELKPLYKKMAIDRWANDSIRRINYKKEDIIEEEIFKLE